jgi:hypothetical protein
VPWSQRLQKYYENIEPENRHPSQRRVRTDPFFADGGMLASALWQLGKINEAKPTMVEASRKAKLAAAWREGVATNSVRTLAKAKSAGSGDRRATLTAESGGESCQHQVRVYSR